MNSDVRQTGCGGAGLSFLLSRHSAHWWAIVEKLQRTPSVLVHILKRSVQPVPPTCPLCSCKRYI